MEYIVGLNARSVQILLGANSRVVPPPTSTLVWRGQWGVQSESKSALPAINLSSRKLAATGRYYCHTVMLRAHIHITTK
eukprot:scaffold2262_cov107-Skeletonema_dohrnii-CCMP3373.AAC.2